MALSNRPSLLSIPREIRNIIYKELLYIRTVIPPSPSDPGLRVTEPLKGICYIGLSSERFPAHSHINLLLCNHQLSAEFLEFLDTANRVWEYAKLDCMATNSGVWPTWTIFPAGRAPKIRNLDIDLRVWDFITPDGVYCGLEESNLLWVELYHILLCLFEDGPTFMPTHHDEDMTSVDTISIQILHQGPATEKGLSEYDEDSQPKGTCLAPDNHLQILAANLAEGLPHKVGTLKLKYGK